ncbi:MAG: histidinol-phosphate transaminase [Pseudomonadota bacterium]
MIAPRAHIAALSPYPLAQLHPRAGKPLIPLAQNESLRPPSPAALQAAAQTLQTGHLYPDPDCTALRQALADLHSVAMESILCGAGSMELIAALAQTFAGPRRAVLAPAHAYPFFRTAAYLAGAPFETASEENGRVSVDALLAAAGPNTGLVFVANPGNPTGTLISRAELARLREGLPKTVLLVIDEAYGEFADHIDAPLFDLVARGDTVVLRSFSKAYGLAGFRVGWGVFPPKIAQDLRKVILPNNVTAASQAAAHGAVLDQAYMRQTCALTIALREDLRQRLRAVGFTVGESFTNFLLIDFQTEGHARSANETLLAEGIILRPQGGVGLHASLRVTVGEAKALDHVARVLSGWHKETPQ